MSIGEKTPCGKKTQNPGGVENKMLLKIKVDYTLNTGGYAKTYKRAKSLKPSQRT